MAENSIQQYYLLQYNPEADYGPTYFIVNNEGYKVADAQLNKIELLENAAGRGIIDVLEEVPDKVIGLTRTKYRAFSKQISKIE